MMTIFHGDSSMVLWAGWGRMRTGFCDDCLGRPSGTKHYLTQYWLIINEVKWHSPEDKKSLETITMCILHISMKITILRLQPHLSETIELNGMHVRWVATTFAHVWHSCSYVRTFKSGTFETLWGTFDTSLNLTTLRHSWYMPTCQRYHASCKFPSAK